MMMMMMYVDPIISEFCDSGFTRGFFPPNGMGWQGTDTHQMSLSVCREYSIFSVLVYTPASYCSYLEL